MKLLHESFISGFFNSGRVAEDGSKVLDWDRAREICRGTDEHVYAGLAEDWTYTSAMIYDGEKFVEERLGNLYVFSRWATPVVRIGYVGDGVECWKYAETEDDPAGYPAGWGEVVDLEGWGDIDWSREDD